MSNLPPAEGDDFFSGNRQSLPQRRGVPAAVLAARLEHELTSMALYAKADKDLTMLSYIAKAKGVLAQLREAMK